MRRFGIGGSLPCAIAPSTALLVVGLLGAALLVQVLVRHARHVEPAGLAEIEPGHHYCVPVRLDESCFDLTFDAGTRYVVIVGSLGASEQRFNIDCSSQKPPAASLEPLALAFALDEAGRENRSTRTIYLGDSPAALQANVPANERPPTSYR